MNTYPLLIVVEQAGDNFSAYSPDLAGCVATGASGDEAEKNMYEAIQMHIEGLKEDGLRDTGAPQRLGVWIHHATDDRRVDAVGDSHRLLRVVGDACSQEDAELVLGSRLGDAEVA